MSKHKQNQNDPIDGFRAQMIERNPDLATLSDAEFISIRDLLRELAKQESRQRAADLKHELLARSNSHCEICGLDVYPILISHHIKPVSELGHGGLTNTIAVCPNCHASLHFLRRKYRKSQEHVWDLMLDAFGVDVFKRLVAVAGEQIDFSEDGKHITIRIDIP